jgi:hypothetical protein
VIAARVRNFSLLHCHKTNPSLLCLKPISATEPFEMSLKDFWKIFEIPLKTSFLRLAIVPGEDASARALYPLRRNAPFRLI